MHTGKGNAKIESTKKTVLLVSAAALEGSRVATSISSAGTRRRRPIPTRTFGGLKHGGSSSLFVNRQTRGRFPSAIAREEEGDDDEP